MTKTPKEIIIAALVAKLGGEVHISMKEYMAAEDAELLRMDNPEFHNAMGFKVKAAPVIIEGEVIPETFADRMAQRSLDAVTHETWTSKA